MQRLWKNKTRLTLICLMAIEVGCAAVPRPKGLLCIAHVPEGYNTCYNMETDFDDRGDIKPGTHPMHLTLDVDKHVNMDPDSYANLKAYTLKVQERIKACAPECF